MAEAATGTGLVPATAPTGLAPAEQRGTLDVRTRALEHLVEAAARQTPGTVSRRGPLGGLGSLVGSASPRATVAMDGPAARIEVDVDAVWPCSAADIATAVRDQVRREAHRFSGLEIRTVDVTLHVVDEDDVDEPERRRVR